MQYNYNPNKLDQTNFSPIFNLNIGLSAGVSINQNFYVGLEGGYFVNDFGFPKNCGGDGGSCSRKIYYSTLGFTSKIIF